MADQQKYTSRLQGTRVLVIGGSSGIGYSVAEALVEHGAEVTIASSKRSRVDGKVKQLKDSYPSAAKAGRVKSGQLCDLASDKAEANIEALFEATGQIDHIVMTAGDNVPTLSLSETTAETIHQAGAVRFTAALLVAKHAPRYISPGPASSITFTGGLVAERPFQNRSVMAGYTAGLQGLVRNLALDLKPIRFNLVSPGAVKTEFWDGIPREQLDPLVDLLKERALTGEVGQPEHVAEAYLYFIKDRFVNGNCIRTDGGALFS